MQPTVAPAPTLPSAGQIWARVREVAQSQGILVPLSGTPPIDVSQTPPQYRALLGAWGPGTWQGNPAGDRAIMVIQSVEGDGTMHAVVGKSGGGGIAATWTMGSGVIDSGGRGALKIIYQTALVYYQRIQSEEIWQIELRPDGTLAGSRDNGASTIVLRRLQ
jgi:hypothetical protein